MEPIYLRNNFNFHDHLELIEHLAKWLKPELYLEIGVRTGDSLMRVQKYSKKCYGVDPVITHRNYENNVELFEMTSDDFFKNINPNIEFDMVFIDGLHEKNQVFRDFVNVKDKVINDGLVILHDTVPMNDYMLSPELCDNAWEAMQAIKIKFKDEWEVLSLPFNPGITIMRKIDWNKQLIWK